MAVADATVSDDLASINKTTAPDESTALSESMALAGPEGTVGQPEPGVVVTDKMVAAQAAPSDAGVLPTAAAPLLGAAMVAGAASAPVLGAATYALAEVGPTLLASSSPVTLAGNPGASSCSLQRDGSDSDPTKYGGHGKISGNSWVGKNVAGVTWTYSDDGRTITVIFEDDFDAQQFPTSSLLITGGNRYSVCNYEYYFQPGDIVKLSTIGLLENNGGNPPEISHLSFYKGDGGWRPTEPGIVEPQPTPDLDPDPSPSVEPGTVTPGPTTLAPQEIPTEGTLPGDLPRADGMAPGQEPSSQALGTSGSSALASTGAESITMIALASAVLLLGTALGLLARRRTAGR
jgi:hypothetical protein